jgi:hypothetical protein
MLSEQTMQIEEPITWVIDRAGDPNINPYSINSVAYSVIMDYLNHQIINDTNINNINNINNIIIEVPSRVQPTIPFAPIAEVLVVTDMAITEEEKDCCVCQEEREDNDICRLNCPHTFCSDCVKKVMDRQKKCPLCRAEITQICVQTEANREKFNGNS